MKLLLLLLLAIFTGCAPMLKTTPARFLLQNEKVLLYPLADNSARTALPGWPADSASRKILDDFLLRLQERITDELRRCEKYGNYVLVDDSTVATVRLGLRLLPARMRGDSLCCGCAVWVKKPGSALQTLDTLFSCGVYKPQAAAENALYYWGYIMADYVRAFPVQQLGRLFYAHRRERQEK
jgi:hypothetical protein